MVLSVNWTVLVVFHKYFPFLQMKVNICFTSVKHKMVISDLVIDKATDTYWILFCLSPALHRRYLRHLPVCPSRNSLELCTAKKPYDRTGGRNHRMNDRMKTNWH